MAARGPRRPLQQTTHNNLANTQAAHRQRLEASAKGATVALPPAVAPQKKPPQLPSPYPSPLSSSAGSAGFRSTGGLSGADSPSSSQPRATSSQSAASPRGSRKRSQVKEARSFSAEAFGHGSLPASPSSAGAGLLQAVTASTPCNDERELSLRSTPRASSSRQGRGPATSHASSGSELPTWQRRSEEDDEANFAADLDDLEDLCQALNMRADDRHLQSEADHRPLTGGTSASTSTTAPGGSSKDFEVASMDLEESASVATAEVHRESENPWDSLTGGQRASYELQQCGSLPLGCRMESAEGVSAQYFFSVDASEGPFAPSTLTFWIKVFPEFPAPDGVSIRCTKKIFHPNVDQETARVKLPHSGTGQEEKLKDILVSLRQLVLCPTDSPAVNADAAMLLQTDPDEFRRVVRSTLGGGEYRGARFDTVLDFGTKKRASPACSSDKQPQMSDQMKVDLMQLDVLQAKLKTLADKMIRENAEECSDLEASRDS